MGTALLFFHSSDIFSYCNMMLNNFVYSSIMAVSPVCIKLCGILSWNRVFLFLSFLVASFTWLVVWLFCFLLENRSFVCFRASSGWFMPAYKFLKYSSFISRTLLFTLFVISIYLFLFTVEISWILSISTSFLFYCFLLL